MSDGEAARPDRPPLPRDSGRGQRSAATDAPVVVTPDYGDGSLLSPIGRAAEMAAVRAAPAPPARPARSKPASPRNPFDAYGERSSRPYALRLPDAIDYVVRQMAAEERTHPLRVVDRILYKYLKKSGRLPPTSGT